MNPDGWLQGIITSFIPSAVLTAFVPDIQKQIRDLAPFKIDGQQHGSSLRQLVAKT